MILEQNSKGYGTNPLDCNTNPKETFLRNNYEASPMDYDRLNNDVKNNESNIESDEHRRKNKRRKGSKSRRKPEEGKNNHNHNGTEDNNKNTSKKSKKRSRKPKQDPSKENQVNNDENLNTKDANRHSKRINKENETNTENITTENPKPRRKHKKKSKPDANSTVAANLEQQIPQLRVINPDLNLANFCEGVTEECRQPRNSKLENTDIQKPMTNLVENFPNNYSFKPFQQLYNPVDTETEDSEKEEPFLNYYDGYIDDYYPLFTDNAAYTANNREVYVKHLGDIKYYYTVDKNNPETFNLPAPVTKEYHKNKNYEEIETTHPKNEIGEEVVQFRTPPLLEVPDFQTRKVERVEINPEAYNNRNEIPKTSTYSPAKQSDMEVKKNGLKTAEDRNIETVFAKSKVAKYGTAYKPEENDISSEEANETKEELIKEDSFKDSGTTYVIAKSVDPFW
ncbi:hypothetical protein HF086_014163 [Spodoptera exigua]|uniref:Uncharacterized protein n=1 Tax=Spodoptera exigua TaxID=7107 RepID=A0A922N0D1_SPOEX|nr:hypothetical protein HF086_014163 [Spodoptera exigua]